VPVFSSEQDVYDHIGRLLVEMVSDPLLAAQLQRADTIVQFRYRDPTATITIDARATSDPVCTMGTTDLVPDVTMDMASDTAHRFFEGKVNVAIALARREILAQGPATKILKLVPLVRPWFARYCAPSGAERPAEPVPA